MAWVAAHKILNQFNSELFSGESDFQLPAGLCLFGTRSRIDSMQYAALANVVAL
jgi:hypothetical protein